MSALGRRIAPRALAALTSPRTRAARRWWLERRRRVARAPHRVLYFHQVDDPYSQLAAQLLPELCRRYEIELAPRLVGPPSDEAAPERERLAAFARRDAADIAKGYRLEFPAAAAAPVPESIGLAERILAAALAPERFAAQAARVGAALWARDGAALEALARSEGAAEADAARALRAEAERERDGLGHYLGAMFHYGGEWYWGVDRLHYLERRLRELGALRAGEGAALIAPRPERAPAPALSAPPSQSRLVLEFYASLRSPYSYIAMERVYALARRYPLELALRPVLPMVMRGLPVPRAKRLYIALDARREAEDAGVAFGRICDPVGRPVERGFSLYPAARSRGRGAEYLLCFARAAFAEGVDTGTDAGLRHVAERAGLRWEELRGQQGREGWREELERNREQLFALGLWGVPSFRLQGGAHGEPDYCSWGQDRLWRVEEEIRRRL